MPHPGAESAIELLSGGVCGWLPGSHEQERGAEAGWRRAYCRVRWICCQSPVRKFSMVGLWTRCNTSSTAPRVTARAMRARTLPTWPKPTSIGPSNRTTLGHAGIRKNVWTVRGWVEADSSPHCSPSGVNHSARRRRRSSSLDKRRASCAPADGTSRNSKWGPSSTRSRATGPALPRGRSARTRSVITSAGCHSFAGIPGYKCANAGLSMACLTSDLTPASPSAGLCQRGSTPCRGATHRWCTPRPSGGDPKAR
jgi:hypothetical protein